MFDAWTNSQAAEQKEQLALAHMQRAFSIHKRSISSDAGTADFNAVVIQRVSGAS